MTLLLLTLGLVAAANPFRVSGTRPTERPLDAALVAGIASVVAAIGLAALSGPFFDAIDITGSSARIAAGVAVVAMGVKDMFTAPPQPTPALAGRWAGLLPIAFPAIFTPAVALLVMAGAADRGVVPAVASATVAIGVALAALVLLRPAMRRIGQSLVGITAVGLGALVVLDGVYAI